MLSCVQCLPVGETARADFGQAARGQRDIGGDADIGGRDALGDPVIRRVRRRVHDDHLHVRQAGRTDWTRAVRDDEHREREAGGHAVDFLADRAGVGVNVDGSHTGASPFSMIR